MASIIYAYCKRIAYCLCSVLILFLLVRFSMFWRGLYQDDNTRIMLSGKQTGENEQIKVFSEDAQKLSADAEANPRHYVATHVHRGRYFCGRNFTYYLEWGGGPKILHLMQISQSQNKSKFHTYGWSFVGPYWRWEDIARTKDVERGYFLDHATIGWLMMKVGEYLKHHAKGGGHRKHSQIIYAHLIIRSLSPWWSLSRSGLSRPGHVTHKHPEYTAAVNCASSTCKIVSLKLFGSAHFEGLDVHSHALKVISVHDVSLFPPSTLICRWRLWLVLLPLEQFHCP
jgi:hypothetical protein